MNKFSVLAAICVALVMIIGGLTVSGEALADDQTVKTISGDAGSVTNAAQVAPKKLTRKEKRALRKKAKKEKAELAKTNESKLICKRERGTTSHIPVRVCRTKEQIEAQREQDQRQIRDLNNAGASSTGASS